MKRIYAFFFMPVMIVVMICGCTHSFHTGGVQSVVSSGSADFDMPHIDKHTTLTRLSNGLSVLIREDSRFPVVSTRLYVRAGSTLESVEQAGISHLLEHMVFKGTKRRPKGSISTEIEAAGGYVNAATSFDYTVYVNDLPDRFWKLGIDAAADMALNATLDAQELSSEKEVVIAELKRGKDNPRSLLFQSMQAGVLKGTPYERPIIGFENTVRSITSDDMKKYVRKLYQPCNMLLTVVGNVKAQDVIDEANRIFSPYQNQGVQTASRPVDVSSLLKDGARVQVVRGAWNKAYFSLGIPVPGGKDSRSIALDMLAELLGGGDTSYFGTKYKYKEKIVDEISVSNVSLADVGMLLINAEMDSAQVPLFWNELLRDMSSLSADMFTDDEISRVSLNMSQAFVRSQETISGLASHLGYMQMFFGGEQGEINYMQVMRSVDLNALNDAIREWIAPRKFYAEFLVPEKNSISDESLNSAMNGIWPSSSDVNREKHVKDAKTEVLSLGEGRTVVLIPDDTMPQMSLSLAFSGGMALALEEHSGIAELTASCLTAGTQSMTRKEFLEAVERRASSINVQAGRNRFTIALSSPSRFSREMLGIFSDVVLNPSFARDEVSREKEMQIAAIAKTEDSPLGLMFRNVPPFLFKNGVYGAVAKGTPQSVEALTPEQLHSFWNTQKRRPWVLSVAGQFDKNVVLEFAKTLPIPSEARVVAGTPEWNTKKELTLSLEGRKQAHLLLIYPTVPEGHSDTPALKLLEEAVGGMGGPLFRIMRDEKGLGYTVSAFNVQNNDYGYMAFYIGTDPSRMREAEQSFKNIIAELGTKELPKKDLARGMAHWEGEYYRTLQGLGVRASEAAELTLNGYPLEHHRTMLKAASSIMPEDIKRIAAQYLKTEPYKVVVLP